MGEVGTSTILRSGASQRGLFSNVDANYGDRVLCCCRRQSVLLVWAPLTSLSLAGQEHGRTISLADLSLRTLPLSPGMRSGAPYTLITAFQTRFAACTAIFSFAH